MSDSAMSRAARLGAIRITGTDAPTFLRAQLTNDVLRLGPDSHFLAAWCDAKGRTLAVARVCERDDGYLLVVPHELIEALVKRLRMFVLRAQVDVADVSDELRITGRIGADLPPPQAREQRGDACLLGLATPPDSEPRALSITPADAPAPAPGMATDDSDWERIEIDSGMPAIVAATQGLFVPQMLNLHWLAAIDFDKGCYPGQEVIARLHYRGRLTRRLFRLAWQGRMPCPGDDLLGAEDSRQGTVIRAAADGDDHGTALAVVKTAAIDHCLHSAHADFTIGNLPYATPA